MACKPDWITGPTVHNCWDFEESPVCPICGAQLHLEFNDGGRVSRTLHGPLWVVTDYYSCENEGCPLNAAFPALRDTVIRRKRFALDVWAQVIWYHVELHLNYKQIRKLLAHDWQVFLSKGAVRDIIQWFEVANESFQDEETRAAVLANGWILLSLDGAQPEKGEAALWVFSDRLTGKVLLVKVLETATHEVLAAAMREVQELYGVPVLAVISDRQENIVQAVQEALPGVPHAFCHYHFLRNVARPVEAKDSSLLTTLRSAVRNLSLVKGGKKQAAVGGEVLASPTYHVLAPLAEELLCAVAPQGDCFKVFPGLEARANLEYVQARLEEVLALDLPKAVRRSLEVVHAALATFLADTLQLQAEAASLRADFDELREILGHRDRAGKKVRAEVRGFAQKLGERLDKLGLESDPAQLQWQQLTYAADPAAVWQEWLRLLHTHEAGLYVAFEWTGLEFTNVPKEHLFGQTKAHFRALYGKKNVARAFQVHAPPYFRLAGHEWDEAGVKEVLLASEEVVVSAGVKVLRAQYATIRRKWKIREQPTGNWEKLEENLRTITESGL